MIANINKQNISANIGTQKINAGIVVPSASWGHIVGNLQNQTDLWNALQQITGSGNTDNYYTKDQINVYTGATAALYSPVAHNHSQYLLTTGTSLNALSLGGSLASNYALKSELGSGASLDIWTGSTAGYEAAVKNNNTIYYIIS